MNSTSENDLAAQRLLPFPSAADVLAERIGRHCELRVQVITTENRGTIASVKRMPWGAVLRIHRSFAAAPDEILAAVACLARGRNTIAARIIRDFFQKNVVTEPSPPRRRSRALHTAGRHHNLAEILADLNRRFFEGRVTSSISWGISRGVRRKRRSRSRHITLGSFSRQQHLITIHPALDRPKVPRFFVESIVFHEMCHEIAGEAAVNGRRRLHMREFRELEARYPQLAEAKAWARCNMEYLLAPSSSRGQAFVPCRWTKSICTE